MLSLIKAIYLSMKQLQSWHGFTGYRKVNGKFLLPGSFVYSLYQSFEEVISMRIRTQSKETILLSKLSKLDC